MSVSCSKATDFVFFLPLFARLMVGTHRCLWWAEATQTGDLMRNALPCSGRDTTECTWTHMLTRYEGHGERLLGGLCTHLQCRGEASAEDLSTAASPAHVLQGSQSPERRLLLDVS
jgi:hypothetical protein